MKMNSYHQTSYALIILILLISALFLLQNYAHDSLLDIYKNYEFYFKKIKFQGRGVFKGVSGSTPLPAQFLKRPILV